MQQSGPGRAASSLLFLLVAACTEATGRAGPLEAPTPVAAQAVAAGIALAHHPELRVSIRTAPSAIYDPIAIGPVGQLVWIRLTNTGTQSRAVDHLDVSFSAARNGVSFPCEEHAANLARVHEPSWLEPGEGFTFERELDCRMPLVGRYDVRAYVRLGNAPAAERGDLAGTFPLELIAHGTTVPQPYPSRDGLFVLLTGSRGTHPLAAEAWARGDYHVVVAVINGSRRNVRVGPASLAFLVYKEGSSLPCSGQGESLALPEELPPGGLRVVHAPVACAPSEEGRYVIVGRLSLRDVGQEIEVGRVPLEVTRDPLLFAPGL